MNRGRGKLKALQFSAGLMTLGLDATAPVPNLDAEREAALTKKSFAVSRF